MMRLETKDNKIIAEFGISGSEQQYYNYFRLAFEKLQKYLNNAQALQGIAHDKLDKDGVFEATEDTTKVEEPLPKLDAEEKQVEIKPMKVML